MQYVIARTPQELPEGLSEAELAEFFHQVMKPYQDSITDCQKGLDYAFARDCGKGGLVLLAMDGDSLQAGAVVLHTGMSGYIPEHVLLFIAVRPQLRGQGIGGHLMELIKQHCSGSIKLHVDHGNPAFRLYERSGFKNKYIEMRYTPDE